MLAEESDFKANSDRDHLFPKDVLPAAAEHESKNGAPADFYGKNNNRTAKTSAASRENKICDMLHVPVRRTPRSIDSPVNQKATHIL